MTATLADSATFSGTAPGDGTVTITLPTNGPRHLVAVALALPTGTTVAPKRTTFAVGDSGGVDVPDWILVADEGPLVLLVAHGPDAATVDVPLRGAGGTVTAIAASFTGASENQGVAGGDQVTVPLESGVGVAVPTIDVDGFVVAAVAADRTVNSVSHTGALTVVDTTTNAALAWGAVTAFSSPAATWAIDFAFDSGRTAEIGVANVTIADAYNDLAVLTSASWQPNVLAGFPAPGDPPAVFTEIVYRSDGVAPEPLPVVTPTPPWWTP